MKLRHTLLAATVALGAAGTAHADTFASAILEVTNFRLLNAAGIPFHANNFDTLAGTNDAHATAVFNGFISNAPLPHSASIFAVPPSLVHQCRGPANACGAFPIAENDFTPLPNSSGNGNFGYADQHLVGSSISFNGQTTGADAYTRADASLGMNGTASGNSDVGTSTTFSFSLTTDQTMTIDFMASAWTRAAVSPDMGPDANANARLSWSVNIIDTTTGNSVFSFAPTQLNALSNVSRTDGLPGVTSYISTNLPFSAITPVLDRNRTYQLTIQHNTLANVLQQQVPEPASLAIFGIGLLGMAAVTRRRRS